MKKEEYIKKLLEQKNLLFGRFNFDEKDLKKCSKEDLIKMLNVWNKIRVIEFMDINEATQELTDGCEVCKEKLEKAKKQNKRILMGIDDLSKYHILGVE